MKRVTFAPTPIMSTYLLAFVVGEFDYVEQRDANGVLVRVYTPVGKASQGQFALDVRSLCFCCGIIYCVRISLFQIAWKVTLIFCLSF